MTVNVVVMKVNTSFNGINIIYMWDFKIELVVVFLIEASGLCKLIYIYSVHCIQ